MKPTKTVSLVTLFHCFLACHEAIGFTIARKNASTGNRYYPRDEILTHSRSFSVRTSPSNAERRSQLQSSTALQLLVSPALLAVAAGSIAGAVGVGCSYPLDTVKTKAQTLRRSVVSSDAMTVAAVRDDTNMLRLMLIVLEREGLSGLFSGVKLTMFGQSVVKAAAFSINTAVLLALQNGEFTQEWSSNVQLLTAACTAGFFTSFLVAPYERIKLMMQAQSYRKYTNEIECVEIVLACEGWWGLLTRGLGVTVAREVPSSGIYFWTYGWMMQHFAMHVPLAPLFFGAFVGMASRFAVYPIDVVKTTLQNTEGGKDVSLCAWMIIQDIWTRGGPGAFFDGVDAKLMRDGVNHAMICLVFDSIMTRC